MPRFTETRYEEIFPGWDYSEEECEFFMAMERYKRLNERPFPTWHEVLRVLKALGYRRVSEDVRRQERPHSE